MYVLLPLVYTFIIENLQLVQSFCLWPLNTMQFKSVGIEFLGIKTQIFNLLNHSIYIRKIITNNSWLFCLVVKQPFVGYLTPNLDFAGKDI